MFSYGFLHMNVLGNQQKFTYINSVSTLDDFLWTMNYRDGWPERERIREISAWRDDDDAKIK